MKDKGQHMDKCKEPAQNRYWYLKRQTIKYQYQPGTVAGEKMGQPGDSQGQPGTKHG